MRLLKLVPDKTNFRFMRWRTVNFTGSIIATIVSLILVAVLSLNFGIDFRGGTLVEIKTINGPADLAQIRLQVGDLGLGDLRGRTSDAKPAAGIDHQQAAVSVL